jgi:CheY-like chemotaxis protein/HPt (histidine-containing phosphotransfer) domain-containing protein
VKFTERGEVIVRAELAEDRDGTVLVRFSVRDSGIGIAPNRINRLFQVFSQVDASTTRKYGGTGLGLAISKQLCQLMGGEIGVESTPGVGSTFWFTLPLRRVPGDPPEGEWLPVELRGLRVLVIDENPTSRDVLLEQLRGWGLSGAAVDRDSALEVLGADEGPSGAYRLAFTRLDCPGTDGPALVRQLQPALARNQIHLIAMISLGVPYDRTQLGRDGFVDVITRPVKQSELFDVIMNALAAPDEQGRRARQRGGAPEVAVASGKHCGVRILVAEDNAINQDVVSEILKRAGYPCEIVSDGRQAVDAVLAKAYDLILMDCQMPELGGLEATQVIRQHEAAGRTAGGRPVAIVALTANAMNSDRDRCLEAGMDDYLSKPLNPRKLIQTIELHLTRRAAAGMDSGPALEQPPVEPAFEGPADQAGTGDPVWDREAFLDRCLNNEAIAERIVRKFRERVAGEISQLRSSVESADAQRCAALAHALKGAAANVSAVRLSHSAADVERAARDGHWPVARTCVARIEAEWDRFQGAVDGATRTPGAEPLPELATTH